MPLAAMGEITGPARDAGRGVGAFNVIGVEHAEAIVTGAEAVRAPVVLQISENCAAYHGALDPIARACLAIAAAAAVPVAVHLDHASSADLVRAAAGLGLGSVMFDASARPYAENVLATAEMTRWCQDRGIWVEAELGEIGGKDGAHAPGVRTDPVEAAAFVTATGVDGLAVAVGTSHAMTRRTAHPDADLIARLAAAVDVPLVLHGSSGVPDEGLRAAVAAGIRKVNVGTQLSAAYSAALRERLGAGPDPRSALTAAREAIAVTVEDLLHVISAPSYATR